MKSISFSFVVVAFALSACGSSESGSSSTDVGIAAQPEVSDATQTPPDSSESDAGSEASTTTSTTLIPVRNTLAGEWRAKAQDILASNLANLGGLPMACNGEIVMNLNADGSFTRGGSMMCAIDSVKTSGQVVNSSGKWEATDDTLTVTVTKSDGYAESIGPDGTTTRIPLPDSGYSSAAYEVTATTLTITFTDPSVGTVTQVYKRG